MQCFVASLFGFMFSFLEILGPEVGAIENGEAVVLIEFIEN